MCIFKLIGLSLIYLQLIIWAKQIKSFRALLMATIFHSFQKSKTVFYQFNNI